MFCFMLKKCSGIREKNVSNGRTVARWSIASILSCVKVRSNPFAVQLTFDTVCKDRQERTYILEHADGQVCMYTLVNIFITLNYSCYYWYCYKLKILQVLSFYLITFIIIKHFK